MSEIILPIEHEWSILSQIEKEFLAKISKSLPKDSNVLELGSWCMGSASIIAANNPHINIYAIDLFDNDQGAGNHPTENNSIVFADRRQKALGDKPRNLENCKNIVKHYSNITCIQNYFFKPIQWLQWDKELDLYFEDGIHSNPWLKNNLEYFSNFLKVNGLLLLHDYNKEYDVFKDVVSNVEKLIKFKNFEFVEQIDTIAVLKKIK